MCSQSGIVVLNVALENSIKFIPGKIPCSPKNAVGNAKRIPGTVLLFTMHKFIFPSVEFAFGQNLNPPPS